MTKKIKQVLDYMKNYLYSANHKPETEWERKEKMNKTVILIQKKH